MNQTIIKYLPVLCIFCADFAFAQSTVTMGGYTDLTLSGLGGVTGNTNANRQYTHSGNYTSGPVFLQTDDLHVNDDLNANDEHSTGLTYDFNYIKAYLAYSSNKSTGSILAQNNADTLVGFSIPYVNHAVMASFINQIDKSDASNYVAAKQFSLAYTYKISKATNLYISRSHIDSVISNVNPMTAITGTGSRELQIGLHHAF